MGGSPSAHAARRAPVQGQLPVGSSPPFRYFCSQCASHRAALQVIVPLELRWAVNRLETWWTALAQHHRGGEAITLPLRLMPALVRATMVMASSRNWHSAILPRRWGSDYSGSRSY